MISLVLMWAARLLVAAILLASLAPFVSTGFWVVRLCDFPRLQLAVIALLTLTLIIAAASLGAWRREHVLLIALVLAIVVWQLAHVLPYTNLWPKQVPTDRDQPSIRVMVVNLQVDNDRHDDIRVSIEDVAPDVLLLIEIDDDWARALQPLAATFQHRHDVIRDEGLGIALWTRIPQLGAETRHLVTDDRPSIFATLEGPGEEQIRFVGIHPEPPGLRKPDGGREDSRERDAELVLVARTVADHPDERWIVAGDFNDVAWSHTTRLFRRLSGLRDPRIGRSLLNTYHAEYPLLRYPIDHVFLSEGIALRSLERRAAPGSDHFAVVADLAFEPPEGASPSPDGDDLEDAQEILREGRESSDDA